MTEKIGGYPARPTAEPKATGTQAARRSVSTGVEQPGGAGESEQGDAVSLTETATRLQVIEARLKDLPDVDRERVEALRTLIEAGEYEVNAQQIARKLTELERLLF